MFETDAPQPDRFEALCKHVEEYEPLPEVLPQGQPLVPGEHEHTDAIDAEILAGLVCP